MINENEVTEVTENEQEVEVSTTEQLQENVEQSTGEVSGEVSGEVTENEQAQKYNVH